MGRLPEYFAGENGDQKVTFRTPYTMAGVITLASSTSGAQFPPNVFTHSTDRPFEIHRVIPRAYSLAVGGALVVPQPSIELLLGCINMRIQDFGKSGSEMTKASTPIINTLKGTSELTWEWAEPYTIIRDGGFIVSLDSVVYPFSNDTVKVSWAFEGFLLTLAPASEKRH